MLSSIISRCVSGAVTAHPQQSFCCVILISAAIGSFSGKQLFCVCSTLDHDYAAIYHPWINSKVITSLQSCLFKGLALLLFVSKLVT